MDIEWFCRICGLEQGDPTWEEGFPSFNICCCCGGGSCGSGGGGTAATAAGGEGLSRAGALSLAFGCGIANGGSGGMAFSRKRTVAH